MGGFFLRSSPNKRNVVKSEEKRYTSGKIKKIPVFRKQISVHFSRILRLKTIFVGSGIAKFPWDR